MIRHHSYHITKNEYSFFEALENTNGRLSDLHFVNWIDLEAPTDDEYAAIEKAFGFHPLTIEDCKHFSLFPKMDEYDNYLFLVMHRMSSKCAENSGQTDDDDARYERIRSYYENDFDKFAVELSEVDIYITASSIVTIHQERIAPFDRHGEKLRRSPEHMKRGRDFLLHEIVDTLIDEYIEICRVWNEAIELLEEDVIDEKAKSVIDRIISMKRNMLLMRRSLSRQKDIVSKLIRGTVIEISKKTMVYLQDVHDHISRLHDDVELNREMLTIIFEAYLSSVSNKMNNIMMKLTVIATVFMPLTFIAGIYGMNFKVFPEIEWHYGYAYVWAIFIVVGAASYGYLNRFNKSL